jgi:hypothetical protein
LEQDVLRVLPAVTHGQQSCDKQWKQATAQQESRKHTASHWNHTISADSRCHYFTCMLKNSG